MAELHERWGRKMFRNHSRRVKATNVTFLSVAERSVSSEARTRSASSSEKKTGKYSVKVHTHYVVILWPTCTYLHMETHQRP